MKKVRLALGILAVTILACVTMSVVFADDVVPAALRLSCERTTQSSSAVTNVTYYQGDYITLTNSVMYTDATGAATQNLYGCTISVVASQPGNTSVTTTATGYIISSNSGTWGAAIICPEVNPAYIQVTVSNTYNYTYPLYRVATQTKLQ